MLKNQFFCDLFSYNKKMIKKNDQEIDILNPYGIGFNPINGKQYSEVYKQHAKSWKELEVYKKKDKIIELLNDKHERKLLFLISGTGTGKSVILPKLVLDSKNYFDGNNSKIIAISEPKKSVVVNTATYAALTSDVELGKEIGYQHRGSSKKYVSPETRLIYMTDGTLATKLYNNPNIFDTIIIDEAHERKVQIDFIMFLLKQLLNDENRQITIILISATIDVNRYVNYFDSNEKKFIYSVVEIPNTTNYPIDIHFLDNKYSDSIDKRFEFGLNIVKDILKDNDEKEESKKESILFFVATKKETKLICDNVFKLENNHSCLQLHSGTSENFEKNSTSANVISSTNSGESGITIPNLSVVIDSGYELYSYFDPETFSYNLNKQFITKSQALQRRGRAGRTKAGTCYLLYKKNEFDNMELYPTPEICRSDITIILLKFEQYLNSSNVYEIIKYLKNNMMDYPSDEYFSLAIKLYEIYDIIDKNNNFTDKKNQIILFNDLSLNQSLFIINGWKLSVAKECCRIVSFIENIEEVIIKPINKRINRNVIWAKYINKKSDHITYLNLINTFLKKKNLQDKIDFCKKSYINHHVMFKIIKNSNKYYNKMIKNKTLFYNENIKLSKETSTNNKIKLALVLSHKHLVAYENKHIWLDIFNIKKKVNLKINKDSTVLLKDIKNKKIIYNRLDLLNDKYELDTITIVPSFAKKMLEY